MLTGTQWAVLATLIEGIKRRAISVDLDLSQEAAQTSNGEFRDYLPDSFASSNPE